MSLKNHPDLFPLLRQTTLRKYADIWSQQYDYLESIILYQAPSSAPYGKKYVLVFKLPKTKSNNKDLKDRINLFKNMFEYFNSIPEIDDNFFREVCNNEYEDSFRDEWLFLTDTPTDVIEQYSWVLYPSKAEKEQDFETFVKQLKIFYENDNEIKIQEPGKDPKAVTCQTLGFKNNTTKDRHFLETSWHRALHEG